MEIPESGLLEKIRPPRLEDAGLEDCALPPDSILEAFQKAAAALRSISSPPLDDEAEGVSEEDEKLDDVVSSMSEPEPEKEKACVDGLQGLEISDEVKKLKDDDQIVGSETKMKGQSTEA